MDQIHEQKVTASALEDDIKSLITGLEVKKIFQGVNSGAPLDVDFIELFLSSQGESYVDGSVA